MCSQTHVLYFSGGCPIYFPVDGEVIVQSRVFPDGFARREVLSLPTLCKFKGLGCPWKGELRNYEVLLTN